MRQVMRIQYLSPRRPAMAQAVVRHWWKDVHCLPMNSVVRLTYCLDMTIVADCDVKPQIKELNEQWKWLFAEYLKGLN